MSRTIETLSTNQVAEDLGKGRTTILRWIQNGTLPSIRVGNTYQVPLAAYLRWKQQYVQSQDTSLPLFPLIAEWQNHLAHGPRALAPTTVRDYQRDFRTYLRLIGGAVTLEQAVARQTLSLALEGMPISGFANRYNVFSAVCSFARYVISRNLVPPEIYNQLKTLRPRRYGQPRRTVLEPDQIHRFITAIWTTTGNTPTEKRTNFALVKTLIGTGLRSKELCELTVKDVDLNRRTLLVRCGKGGKQRLLGLSQELAKVLSQYAREVRPHTIVDRFFVTESGRAITPTTLSRRISGSSTVSGGIWGGDGGVTVG